MWNVEKRRGVSLTVRSDLVFIETVMRIGKER